MTLPLTFLAWESACEQYSRTFSPCVSFHPAKEEAFHTRQILWFLSFMLLLHVCSSKKAAIGNKIHSQWEQRMERMETTRFHSFTWGGGHSSARSWQLRKEKCRSPGSELPYPHLVTFPGCRRTSCYLQEFVDFHGQVQ